MARITTIYAFGNYVETPGGLIFNSITASGSFTFGTTAADETSSADIVETYGGDTYTYHLTGREDGPGWGPLPSQLPPTSFPGFPDIPPSPATFHLGLLQVGQVSATFLDNIYPLDGFVTVSVREIAAPEPTTWALMLIGLGAVGLTFRAHRRNAAATV
jgi:hypothetical protein